MSLFYPAVLLICSLCSVLLYRLFTDQQRGYSIQFKNAYPKPRARGVRLRYRQKDDWGILYQEGQEDIFLYGKRLQPNSYILLVPSEEFWHQIVPESFEDKREIVLSRVQQELDKTKHKIDYQIQDLDSYDSLKALIFRGL